MAVHSELSPQLQEKYEVLGEISRGGMGVVFKALHKKLGKIVAIKVILVESPDTEDVQRFEREAIALAQLRHPNIVQVFDFSGFNSNSPAYMVMEYIEGQTFDSWVKEHLRVHGEVPPIKESAALLETIASALSYCHSRGVAHRDLKPVNIVIERDSKRPVLLDFGLVKVDSERLGDQYTMLGSPLTATGDILGTPAFMAPEQIDSSGQFGALGPACDIWGLGGLLFFAVTGHPPHRGDNLIEIYGHILDGEVSMPRTLNDSVPDWIEDLCSACLIRDARARIDMADVRERIRSGGGEAAPSRESKKSSALLFAMLFILGFGLSLGLLFFFVKSPSAAPQLQIDGGVKRVTKQRSVLLKGRVSNAITLKFRIKLGSKIWKKAVNVEGQEAFEVALDLPGEDDEDGVFQISAWAEAEGQSETRSFEVKLDRTAPAITLNAEKLTHMATASIEVKGDEALSSFIVNGATMATDSQGRLNPALKIGRNTIEVAASDALGNVSEVSTIVIDRRPLYIVSKTLTGAHPFFSMQGVKRSRSLREAVESAPKGSKIAIFPGSYEAGVNIDRELILEGIGERDSIHLTASNQACVIGVTKCRFTLRNLKIDSQWSLASKIDGMIRSRAQAIMINESSGLIENCHVTKTFGGLGAGSLMGQRAQVSPGNIIVKNCLFDDCKSVAIGLQAGVRMIIDHCQFRRNGKEAGSNFASNRAGFEMSHCSIESSSVALRATSVTDGKIMSCTFRKNGAALALDQGSKIFVKNSRFLENGKRQGAQLKIFDSQIRAEKCEFLRGDQHGFWLNNASRGTFIDCKFLYNKGFAGVVYNREERTREARGVFRNCIFDNFNPERPGGRVEFDVRKDGKLYFRDSTFRAKKPMIRAQSEDQVDFGRAGKPKNLKIFLARQK